MEQTPSERDLIADERDRLADERERKADQRDLEADERDRRAAATEAPEGSADAEPAAHDDRFGIHLGPRGVRPDAEDDEEIITPPSERRPSRSLSERLRSAAAARHEKDPPSD